MCLQLANKPDIFRQGINLMLSSATTIRSLSQLLVQTAGRENLLYAHKQISRRAGRVKLSAVVCTGSKENRQEWS